MMEKYEKAEVEIIVFHDEEIVTVSAPVNDTDGPWVP